MAKRTISTMFACILCASIAACDDREGAVPTLPSPNYDAGALDAGRLDAEAGTSEAGTDAGPSDAATD